MTAPANPNSLTNTPKFFPFELTREERIKENLQRMQQLGISNKLDPLIPPKRRCRRPRKPSSFAPTRRSLRLQNMYPVSHSVDARSEVYTKEHEKLLGNAERRWELLVDGYGQDGKHIYDRVNGKACHQCRKTTLGHHTQCSKCNMPKGQLCGDCLYKRYRENMFEVLQNPKWVCPVCRKFVTVVCVEGRKDCLLLGNLRRRSQK